MKKRTSLMAVLLLCMVQAVFAQSVDDAQKNLYYQKYTTAKQQLQQIVSSKPNAEAYYYLGLADMGLENYDQAKADFQKGLQADPESALNMVGMGAIAIHDKNYDGAKQQFQKAYDQSEGRDFDVVRAILGATARSAAADEQFALNLVNQFKENRRNRKYDMTAADYVAIGNVYANLPNGGGQAASSYETAQTLDAKYAKAYSEEGNLYDRARQDSIALKLWNQAVAADPNYAPAFYQLYQYYRARLFETYQKDDLDKAQNYLKQYMALADDKVNTQVNLVDILYLQRNYQQAIDQAKQLMGQVNEGTQTRLYKLIAVSQLAMGDSLAAKQSMDTYFQRQDTSDVLPFDYKTYADILGKLNEDSLELVYLQKFVDKDTTTNLPFIRGEADKLAKQENWNGAALWYSKEIEVNKGKPSASDYFYRAYYELVASDYPKAEQDFKAMTEKMPDQPSGFYYLGVSQAAQDTSFSGAAIEAFNKYLGMMKSDTSKSAGDHKSQLNRIYNYLGGYYFSKGDYVKAGDYAEKLLTEVNPQSPEALNILYNIAAYYTRQKDRDNSMAYIKKMQAVNPDSQGAQTLLDYWKQVDEYQAKMKEYKKKQKAAQNG